MVFAQKEERSQIIIPTKQIIKIDYPLYFGYYLKIWNESKYELEVSARDKKTDSIRESIKLNKGSDAQLEVDEGMYVQFENRFLSTIKVAFTMHRGNEVKLKSQPQLTPQRAFYLENNTAQVLPIRIPGVMNPNLEPFSRSGVDLVNGKKFL